MSPLPLNSCFIFSKVGGSAWYEDKKKQSLKDICFYQVAGWEKPCFLVSFFCDTKLDVEKTSYLAKVVYSKRNGSLGSR